MIEDKKVFTLDEAMTQKTMDGFDNFVARLGLNNDNTLSAGFYTFNLMTRNRIQLEAAYRGSWVVGQVIDTYADDMTKAGIDIQTADADGESNIKKIQASMGKKLIWKSIRDGIAWGRLYGGAIGVLQIEGQDLSTPLKIETVGKDQFKGIAIYDRWQLNPVLYPVIDSGPEIGLPKFYQITTGLTSSSPAAPTVTGQITVHHSRCIRFIGIQLPFFQAITEMMWGESILERLWDRLISFDSATMSCANLIERANNRVVGVENLREILAAGGKAQQALESQFEMMRVMQTNEGLTLIDKEDNFQSIQYTFSGLADLMLQFGQQLSGSSGIPLVRLFGQSPAGLNSTGDSDIRMYYDNINAQQISRLAPGVEVLLRVMWQSVLGKPAPDDLEWNFVPLWQMSALDKATVAKSNTETIIGAHDAGLCPTQTAMEELRAMSDETGLFANISDEDIQDAEVEEPPEPDMNEPVKPDKPEPEKLPKPVGDSLWRRFKMRMNKGVKHARDSKT